MLAIWTVTAFSLRSERQSLIERSRSEARNLASAIAADAGNALDRVAASMAVIAQHMGKLANPADFQTLSALIPLLGDGRIEASIVGPDGRLISTGFDSGAPTIDLSDREEVRAHFDNSGGGIFVAKPVQDPASNQPRIPVSRRVDGADGQLLGIIIYSLPPSALLPLHRSIDLGSTG